MENSNGKEDCSSDQESPQALCKASKDMSQPSGYTCKTK